MLDLWTVGVRISSLLSGLLVLLQLFQRVKVILHRLIELGRTHAIRLLNGLFDGHMLQLDQPEVSAGLAKLVFVQQVVHGDPRLRVEQRAMRALLVTGCVVPHGE